MLFDANGEIADDVFADPFLPLDLGDRRRRAVDVQKHEMGFAVFVHPIGQRTYAPVFHLHDLAAELLDDAGHLGGQFLDLLGARILAREKNMLIKRHGCPFLSVGVVPGGKPFEAFGKDSEISSEGGSTGRRTDWSCHINVAKKVRLLRPSVQLPAGIHGWRGLYGFWPPWQWKAADITACFGRKISAWLDIAVPRSVFRPNS